MNCPSQPTLWRQSPSWLPGPLDERARARAQPARHVPGRGWGLWRKGGGKGGGIQEGVTKRFLNSWSGLGSQLLSREQSPDFNETSKSGRWLGFPREWGVEPVPHTDKVARSARLALETKVGATVVQESTNKGIYGVLYFLVSSGGTVLTRINYQLIFISSSVLGTVITFDAFICTLLWSVSYSFLRSFTSPFCLVSCNYGP